MTKTYSIMLAMLMGATAMVCAKDHVLHTFKKITLSDQFYCEGINCGDFNHDGKMDIVASSFWYEGPDFQKKHEFRPSKTYEPKGYSDNFITFAYDFNGDGWTDIFEIGMPGEEAWWYENPQGKPEVWKKHVAFKTADNESPDFGDIDGDGKPELIFNSDGFLGYAKPDPKNPEALWKFHPISPKGSWHKYTHGTGFGDINGDGRTDYLEINGWWEQPASLENDPVWKLHPFTFGEGGAQMLVYDVNGDGFNDVITTLHPHQYGLAWYEQTRENGQISFTKHLIMGSKAEDNKYGVKFTQAHAFALADIDGDGLKDFVTGKRWWAHAPPTDPEGNEPAVLYWFKLVRGAGNTAEYIPYKVDDNSGVGTQVVAADVNGDGMPDILVGNKKGIFVFLNEKRTVSQEEWDKAQPQPLK
jgi:hypothetical protein